MTRAKPPLSPMPFEPVDIAAAITLPAYCYTSAEYWQHDQQVLQRQWQLIGSASELASIGSHMVGEVAGKPIIVVRGDDDKIRAFYNVCQHRAGPLARENGCARRLVCRYHGWTYDLQGQLLRAPEMEGACEFDVNKIHLKPIHVTLWQGLVFVALEQPAHSLDEIFAGISETILPIQLSAMSFYRRTTYDIACNWKIYVDNYLEGYHLPLVHPGLSKVLDYRAYDTSLFAHYSYQHSPLDGAAGPYSAGQAHYYCVLPNMMLNILPNRLQTNIVIPLSVDRCQVVFDYYYTDIQSEATKKLINEDASFADEVQQEDIEICERVQKGLASGAYYAGRYSPKRETGVWHFHQWLAANYAKLNRTRN